MAYDMMDLHPEELRRILKMEFELHPQAGLADIFKFLNQAYFGPTHMDPDPARIYAGLRRELDSLTKITGEIYQDIGCGRGFVRLNLNSPALFFDVPASPGKLASEEIQKLFREISRDRIDEIIRRIIASRCARPVDPDLWRDLWQKALPFLREFLDPAEEELAEMEQLIDKNQMPSHTGLYKELYDPHYRVIHINECREIPGLQRSSKEIS